MKIGAVVVAVGLAACGSGSPHAEPVVVAPPPTCAQAADHMQSLLPDPTSAEATKTHDVLAMRCAADAWAVEVRTCIATKPALNAPPSCLEKLSAEQRTAFRADLATIESQPPAPDASGTVDMSTWPPECRDYYAAMIAFATCDKVPETVRDSMRESIRTFGLGLDPHSSPDVQRAVGDACKAGGDAIKQAASSMGC